MDGCGLDMLKMAAAKAFCRNAVAFTWSGFYIRRIRSFFLKEKNHPSVSGMESSI